LVIEKYGSLVAKFSAVYCGFGLTVTAGVAVGSRTLSVPYVLSCDGQWAITWTVPVPLAPVWYVTVTPALNPAPIDTELGDTEQLLTEPVQPVMLSATPFALCVLVSVTVNEYVCVALAETRTLSLEGMTIPLPAFGLIVLGIIPPLTCAPAVAQVPANTRRNIANSFRSGFGFETRSRRDRLPRMTRRRLNASPMSPT
jgi:hypothetical protein